MRMQFARSSLPHGTMSGCHGDSDGAAALFVDSDGSVQDLARQQHLPAPPTRDRVATTGS